MASEINERKISYAEMIEIVKQTQNLKPRDCGAEAIYYTTKNNIGVLQISDFLCSNDEIDEFNKAIEVIADLKSSGINIAEIYGYFNNLVFIEHINANPTYSNLNKESIIRSAKKMAQCEQVKFDKLVLDFYKIFNARLNLDLHSDNVLQNKQGFSFIDLRKLNNNLNLNEQCFELVQTVLPDLAFHQFCPYEDNELYRSKILRESTVQIAQKISESFEKIGFDINNIKSHYFTGNEKFVAEIIKQARV